jgi:hypothetical protein
MMGGLLFISMIKFVLILIYILHENDLMVCVDCRMRFFCSMALSIIVKVICYIICLNFLFGFAFSFFVQNFILIYCNWNVML